MKIKCFIKLLSLTPLISFLNCSDPVVSRVNVSEDSQNVVVLDHKVEDSNKTLSLLNSSTNPNDQGWKLFIAAGPELYQRMNNGEEYPLTVKSSKTERDYIELKSVGTDNIHFNIALPIGY